MAHENAYLAHLEAQGVSILNLRNIDDSERALAETREAMESGVEAIAQATLASGRWFGRSDVLRRARVPSAKFSMRRARFNTPEGHPMELLWDVDYVTAAAGKETPLRNRPQKRPQTGVLDFMVDILGFRERERVVGDDDGSLLASFLSVTNLSHDIAIVPEPTEMRGRLHHVCFHYTSLQHLFDVAELAKEAGIAIEHGPARHGIGGASFLYMLEPGGNRIELMGDPGYMIFDPAWRTVVWKGSEVPAVGAIWTGSPLPDSFWSYGTPPNEERLATPEAAAA